MVGEFKECNKCKSMVFERIKKITDIKTQKYPQEF